MDTHCHGPIKMLNNKNALIALSFCITGLDMMWHCFGAQGQCKHREHHPRSSGYPHSSKLSTPKPHPHSTSTPAYTINYSSYFYSAIVISCFLQHQYTNFCMLFIVGPYQWNFMTFDHQYHMPKVTVTKTMAPRAPVANCFFFGVCPCYVQNFLKENNGHGGEN